MPTELSVKPDTTAFAGALMVEDGAQQEATALQPLDGRTGKRSALGSSKVRRGRLSSRDLSLQLLGIWQLEPTVDCQLPPPIVSRLSADALVI